jgi:hypothetical protein
MPRTKTDTEFMEASKHLYYEIWMLNKIALMANPMKDQFDKNLLIETFCLHMRNLIKFFYDENLSNDDIIAHNFVFSVENWLKNRPVETKLLIAANARADKEVMHLTDKRINEPFQKSDWEFREIHKQLTEIIKVFYRFVPDQKLCAEMIELRNSYR